MDTNYKIFKMLPEKMKAILVAGLAALAARGETGLFSEENCDIAAADIGWFEAYSRLLRQRTDPGTPLSNMNPEEIMDAYRKIQQRLAKEFKSLEQETKRRGMTLPKEFTRAFSFEE